MTRSLGIAVVSFTAALGLAASASAAPSLTRDQVYALFAAGGFPVGTTNHPVNRCGQPANPHMTFVDLNGDNRLEALFVDAGSCYKPDGRWFAIVTQEPDGAWRRILEGEGTLRTDGTRSGQWFVLTMTGAGRTTRLHYNGTAYVAGNAPPPAPLATPVPSSRHPVRAKAAPKTAPAVPPAAAGPDAAIFLAAGLKFVHGRWESGCNDGNDAKNDSYTPARITERKDLNGDGRTDAVIVESGTFCYGNTGQAFWIVAGEPNGHWKHITDAIGIPDFQKARGVDGWPDILVGGPGMCFPVDRWNGVTYETIAHNDGEKPCNPFR